jgi:hypothetical protein
MGNPLYSLNNNTGRNNKSIVEQFIEFKNTFQGNPQEKINQMLQSGQVTQKQVEDATALANMIKNLSKR